MKDGYLGFLALSMVVMGLVIAATLGIAKAKDAASRSKEYCIEIILANGDEIQYQSGPTVRNLDFFRHDHNVLSVRYTDENGHRVYQEYSIPHIRSWKGYYHYE